MGIETQSSADYLRDVAQAVGANDLGKAFEAATAAQRSGAEHPAFHNARALYFQAQGRLPDALKEFERARVLAPRDPHLLNAIGLCYVRCDRVAEGIAALDAALAIAPDSPLIHFRKGWALANSGDRTAARRAYEKAIELKPDYAEALAGVASLAARDGDAETARSYAERCRELDPTEPTAIVALAMVENAAGNFEEAEGLLREGLKDARAVGHAKAVLSSFLGDALDGQNRTEEAFAAYRTKADTFRQMHAPRLADGPPMTKVMASLAAYLESIPAERWQTKASPKPCPGAPKEHVFLLGFIRSGTTLLERVLEMHPEIVSLEERETLQEASQQYMHVPAGLNRLLALEGAALDDARAAYWKRVRDYGVEPEGKVFIDKQPLNTFNLPLIARLFPEAKILFAIRDPRDVVFSSFRRHFEVNRTVFELLDPADGARFYASVMNVGALCREKLPLTLHEHRYEDMIADFDGRVRAVCDFLGIEWTEAMRNFSEKARQDTIRSPSAAQVRKPLYNEGVGQWRRYAKHFGPALPILAPWVRHFGYTAD